MFALPALPQFLNQDPPRPQQLSLPDFSMVPHLGHTELVAVVVTAGVHMQTLVKGKRRKTLIQLLTEDICIYMPLALNLRWQASTPSNHM